jgi:hypothetical protein
MHPAVRLLGILLRLVGISSPEDTAPHPSHPTYPSESGRESRKPVGPPSWRSPSPAPANPPASTLPPPPPKDNQPSV